MQLDHKLLFQKLLKIPEKDPKRSNVIVSGFTEKDYQLFLRILEAKSPKEIEDIPDAFFIRCFNASELLADSLDFEPAFHMICRRIEQAKSKGLRRVL